MRWWWPTPPQRTDDEITARINTMVSTGQIRADQAPMYERALRDEVDGKAIVMRDPGIRPRPPRRPSWASRWE